MKLVTRQSKAAEAPSAWAEQYRRNATQEQQAITRQLAALPQPVDPDRVDAIIGNTSWTHVSSCDSCGARPSVVVEVGQEPDFESRTAYLCADCVSEAAKLVAGSVGAHERKAP